MSNTNHMQQPDAAMYSRYEVMTKDRVAKYLAMNTRNRRPKQLAIDAYARDMERGDWMPTNQGIGISESGVLLDGQNRLMAIQKSGAYGTVMLVCSGLPDAAQKAIDVGARRSSTDVFNLLMGNADATNWHVALARVIYIHRVLDWTAGRTITNSELYDVFTDTFQEAVRIAKLSGGYKTMNAPTAAAFVEAASSLYSDHADSVYALAEQVSSGELLQPKTPALILHRYISGIRGRSGGMKLQRERFFKTLNAISAHVEGRKMDKLYATDPRQK